MIVPSNSRRLQGLSTTLAALEKFRIQEDRRDIKAFVFPDVRIVSFPRSGRTWIKRMTQHIQFALGYNSHQQLVLFKHDGARIRGIDKFPVKYIADKSFYRKRRVVLLVREPRDVVASHYFMLRDRLYCEDILETNMTIGQFARHGLGLPFVIRFMNDWVKQKDKPKDFNIFYYEDFLKDPVARFKEFCHWIGIENQGDDIFENAVRACDFKNMQDHDIQCASLLLRRPIDPRNINALSVREGKAGTFWKWFEEKDLQWMKEFIVKNLHPFYRHMYPLEDRENEDHGQS